MKKNFFAVKNGRKIGIFDNWKECEESISGFSGQEYKAFSTYEEANIYLNSVDSKKQNYNEESDKNVVCAYVASYCKPDIETYSYGNVIITPSGEVIKNSNNGNNPQYLISNELAGRVLGAIDVITRCIDSGYENIILYSNSEDIGNFASGKWKPKAHISNEFTKFIFSNNKAKVEFRKIDKTQDKGYFKCAQDLADKEIVNCSKKKIDKNNGKCLVAEGIKKEELIAIIDLLKDEYKLNVNVTENDNNIIYKFNLDRENCTLHFYKKNNKIMIQGKFTGLFSNLANYIIELVETEKIPEIFNEYYNVNIDKKQIKEMYKIYLPDVPENISSKFKKHLTQAIYNLIFEGDIYEASFLLFPCLRVSEGIIKKFLMDNNITYIDKLDVFEKNDKKKFVLKQELKKNLKNKLKVEKIEELYGFYYRQRHTLFHWGSPGVIDDTREVNNCHDAHELIKGNLSLINQYYKL